MVLVSVIRFSVVKVLEQSQMVDDMFKKKINKKKISQPALPFGSKSHEFFSWCIHTIPGTVRYFWY